MKIPRNNFKAAIQRRELQIGLWSGLADAVGAEICAAAGFHWIMLDCEHSPNTLRDVLAQLQAMAPYPTQAVVRPPIGDVAIIKQLLDIGVQTLLIPMVETAEQASLLARSMRYPSPEAAAQGLPTGFRGIGGATSRAARWGRVENYLHEADAQVCLLVQVETRLGLENLEAIAAVDGVDGIFVGPSDLTASLGMLGQAMAPEGQPAIEGAITRACATGKPVGSLAIDQRLAARYIELGCTFMAVGIDTLLLRHGAEELRQRFK
jgi:4-hydroxy-2-oxoheptanedioate aldolase